jgi:uncharacterized phage-associated protein
MAVRFEFDSGRMIAAVTYLVWKRPPEITKWKICKLLYLADKLHLVRYGRPISGDVYYALPWGPVPSYTLDALDDENELAMELRANLEEVANSFRYPQYALKRAAGEPSFEALSESDRKILDEVLRRFGGMSFKTLSGEVDRSAAYRKAWRRRTGDRSLMRFEDFFEDEPTARREFLEELTENAALEEE